MDKLIKHGGELYQYHDGGVIAGYIKAKVPDGTPFIEWNGSKMPHSLWQSILAFFIWTYEDTKKNSSSPDEALVHLYYNEGKEEWLAWAPPQKGCGMTVRTVNDHPNWKQEQEFVDFIKVGTGHHHCNASAFQSGTDRSDEFDQGNGIHFTIGELGRDFLDIHARAVFNGNMSVVQDKDNLGMRDWVEMADKYKEIKKFPELEYAAYYYSLKSRPDRDVSFPDTWKENYLKQTVSQYGLGFHGNNGTSMLVPPNGKVAGRDGYWSRVGGADPVWIDLSGSGAGNDSKKKQGSQPTNAEKAEAEIEALISRGVSLIEIALTCEEMSKLFKNDRNKSSLMTQLNDILNTYGMNIRWLEKHIEECVQFDAEQAYKYGCA